MSGSSLPLVVEWAPGAVRVVDPLTGKQTRGTTMAECGPERGRDVVVGVARRSAFVRLLPVPRASRGEMERVLATRLMGSLPLEPRDLVFGYRLSSDGRAAVGAMRAESLIRLYAEAQAAGLRVRAVLPVAFGAWLAAREHGVARGAVLGVEDGLLDIDVIEDGELAYSRAVPTDTPVEDADDEVLRTFATVGMPPSPVLALAAPELPAERHDPREALLRLADPRAIETRLFTLELPARRAARLARAHRLRVGRTLAAAGLALATGGYALSVRARSGKPVIPPKSLMDSVRKARHDRSDAETRLNEANRANRVLDVAFEPAQTTGDVVAALANGVPPDAWITALSVGRGVPVLLAGSAMHGADVGRFFAGLAKNPRFARMQVVSTSVGSVGKTPVVQFNIVGDAVGVAPYDRPVRRTKAVAKAR